MPLIKSLAHACIKTSDLDATSAFYCEALGLEKLFTFTRKGVAIGFYLKAANNTFIEVFRQDQTPPGAPDRSLHHFCLEAGEIEAARELLLSRGYQPGAVKLGCDKSWQFWVKDPSGIDLEFHQYTDHSSQTTGEDVEVDW
jgi:catechol 2,3-dioxygenase-like lactoylglutathione lyase family enzyme